ncbi:hypothetical protein [Pedobacter mendelii]|uniref:DUF4377 domain-containing protein n=1 Tax=Pedobacter mendelii TaxID=1908240 RepID=A0ABQ2BPL0_9SPHI|nr:hypothetical protein [Pedobacter mendelii]GGI29167.1 hypothetical protein GCM10008119_36290 [Pedobacter mendelii]
MKNFIVLFALAITLFACKKSIPEPDVIRLNVYITEIEHTNENEPSFLYWYVRKAKSGGFYYVTSTKRTSDFTDYNFNHSLNMPTDLEGAFQLKDIVVSINNLKGKIKTDY